MRPGLNQSLPGLPCLTQVNFLYIVEVMSNRDYLGEFEHIVLLAVLRLDDQAYGVTVRREIVVPVRVATACGAGPFNRADSSM